MIGPEVAAAGEARFLKKPFLGLTLQGHRVSLLSLEELTLTSDFPPVVKTSVQSESVITRTV